jgi:hypothetical protein
MLCRLLFFFFGHSLLFPEPLVKPGLVAVLRTLNGLFRSFAGRRRFLVAIAGALVLVLALMLELFPLAPPLLRMLAGRQLIDRNSAAYGVQRREYAHFAHDALPSLLSNKKLMLRVKLARVCCYLWWSLRASANFVEQDWPCMMKHAKDSAPPPQSPGQHVGHDRFFKSAFCRPSHALPSQSRMPNFITAMALKSLESLLSRCVAIRCSSTTQIHPTHPGQSSSSDCVATPQHRR